MLKVWNKRGFMAATAFGALMVPAIATAADMPAEAGASPQQATSAEAEEPADARAATNDIVVTAQRRSESIQKVPAAVTALSGDEIAARGIADTQALQFAAPSLAVGTQVGITMISIRGVGLSQRQGSPGVGVYVDGIYQPRPSLGDITQVDLARVEVLRGPQGTLYGRNTTGGAVNFISNAPSDTFEGYVLVGAKTYDDYRLQGVMNIPLGGSWAARAVVNYDNRSDGLIKNVVPGQPDFNHGEILSGRFRVAGEIADGLSLDIEAAGQRSEGAFDYFTLSNAPSAAVVARKPALASATVTTEKFRSAGDEPSDTYRQYQLYAATLSWASPLGELKSVSSYQYYRDRSRYDADALNLPVIIAAYANETRTYIQELLLNSRIGPIDTVAGVFVMRDDAKTNFTFTFPTGLAPLPPSGHLDIQQKKYRTDSWAGYVDGTWQLAPGFRLIGGARYSVDKLDVISGTVLGLVTPGGIVPVSVTCPVHEDHQRFEAFTPRAGAQYDLSADANIYGTVARGFKSGGVNVASCGNKYAPEKITAYELGFKSRLFDRRLLLNASAFYYDYTNLQVAQTIGFQAQITNAAAATVKGVEVEASYTPDNHWTFNANANYLDATYKRFSDIDTLNPLAGLQTLDGQRLNYSPKWSLNGGVAYTTGKGSWGSLQARIDGSYRSTVYFRPFNAPLDSQPAYALVNLGLLWTAPSETFSVRLFANNVTNQGYRVTQGSADSLGSRYVVWGTPRQLGVELRANFR